MKPVQRRLIERENEIRRKYFERMFMKKVFNSLKAFRMHYVGILKERGIDAVRSSLNRALLDAGIGAVINDIYLIVGMSYARISYGQVMRSAKETQQKPKKGRPSNERKALRVKLITPSMTPGGQINFNETWRNMIMEYFRMYLIDKAVRPITLESKKRIMEILDIGIAEGWSIERMAKELETDRFLLNYTRLVVRTETAKAAYYGRRIGAASTPFETTKEWISSRDSRVRHSHSEMDGVILDSAEKYKVARYKKGQVVGYDLMNGPGDPVASAENVCNCRCTEGYASKRDANGRLIRKPSNRISIINPGDFNRPVNTITV